MPLVWQLILIQLVAFTGLVLVLRKILYSMSADEADRLKRLSEQNEKKARDLSRKLGETDEECQLRLQRAENELREVRNKARAEAAEAKREILDKARQEAQAITQRALNAREQIREQAESMVAAKSVDLALQLVREVLTTANQRHLHEGLVRESLDELGDLDPRLLQGVPETGRLVAARPLKEGVEAEVAARIGEKAGKPVTLTLERAPDRIAGISIELGNLVLDGTLLGRLMDGAEAVRNL